jgi:3-oxoacyl-[acyl-carrier-protein] synthase-1
MTPLVVTRFATANPLGLGCGATFRRLRERVSALRRNDLAFAAEVNTWIGRVDGVEQAPVTGALAAYDCRNNRLAQLGLRQDGFEERVARARQRYGARRIAVLIGTTTSGMLETELAYVSGALLHAEDARSFRYQTTQNVFSVADFVRRYLELEGPATAISTACSSSAKVFASAARMIGAGFVDAAVVGGVDSLCMTPLYGFRSLELLSPDPCRPCDADRDGISIGEASGFALLEADAGAGGEAMLLGFGESSDAFHMSSPHPEGEGAYLAMRDALARAGIAPSEVGYVNMHGTGTRANDGVEDKALYRLFGDAVPCSSTKGWTGHTLGAAGITEAVVSVLCLRNGYMPGSVNLSRLDPALRSHIAIGPEARDLSCVLSNSFGFGGSNCSLLFGRMA